MSDKLTMEDLAGILARLEKEWQELAALLQSHGQPRALEAEKILLRDAAGTSRGIISVEEDGSTVLHLSDAAGQAWAKLGINSEGQAFLELKDRERETGFKLRASPSPTISSALPLNSKAARVSPAEMEKLQPPPESAEATPPAEPAEPEHPGAPTRVEFPEEDVPPAVAARLAQLEQRHRRQWLFQIPVLVIVLLVLAAQAYWLLKPSGRLEVSSLVLRDPQGHIQAYLGRRGGKMGLRLWDDHGKKRASLELGAQGSPALILYDRKQEPRADLRLGPEGNPTFNLRDILSLPGQVQPQARQDPAPGPTALAPPAAPAAAPASEKAPAPAVTAPEVFYVGSITSNRYHYPTCKWAKTILPHKVIKFHSVEEARQLHYIPCPVCKPPPLKP